MVSSRAALAVAFSSTLCADLFAQSAGAAGGSPPLRSGGAGAHPMTIRRGDAAVTIDPLGVVTDVTPNGFTTTFGPPIRIARKPASSATPSGIVEWVGVEYDSPRGPVLAVASGLRPDYAGRKPVVELFAKASADEATTVTRAGDVELHTTFSFDSAGAQLIVGVEVVNVGTTDLADVVVSREWAVDDPAATTFPEPWSDGLPKAPAGVHRVCVEVDALRAGRSQAVSWSFELAAAGRPPAAVDVPLQTWTNATFPTGLDFGKTNGISFGDVDHDGWIDVFTCYGRQLWRNVDGADWQKVGNLKSLIPAGEFNYNGCVADYDGDQLADLFTEPRGNCAHVLQNLGSNQFQDVGGDTNVVDVQPCGAFSETICVFDADGDGYLDVFGPSYPPPLSTGHWFLQNLGPVGPGNAFAFHENAVAAGLVLPPLVGVPEGAGIGDVDGDGDSDLYCNGTLYRNVSAPGAPLFEAMSEAGSGITRSGSVDEGAGLLDYDMDGDLDVCVRFCDATLGVRMFEARGDGTWFLTAKTLFDSWNTGACLGLSFEDWDNDGDVDVNTSEVFRRNQLVETGTRHFTVATHALDPAQINDATPAWGDFDKDGDVDTACGNWLSTGHLFENTLYDASTPADQRRYVRVKPVRDSASFSDGLESEFGAIVSVRPLGAAADGLARRKICAPSNGYLNQGEYTLHFALPPDPDPADPAVDLDFEVAVDFAGASGGGVLRIDRHVNPVLGAIRLATLADREIVVYRSGRVRLDGADYLPAVPPPPLTTTTGGLVAPGVQSAIPPLVGAPAGDWFVGTEISTATATTPQRIEELLLDGHLDAPVACGNVSGNVFVWDVTTPGAPLLVSGGHVERSTQPRNHRSFLPLDVTLTPNRVYRIVARVTKLRATPIAAPVVDGPFTTQGGLSFQDASPCTGTAAAAAVVDPANVYVAVRFRDEPSSAWADLGNGLAGASGIPLLVGGGSLVAGSTTTLDVSGAAPNAGLFHVVGTSTNSFFFAGGVLVPAFDLIVGGHATDGSGHATLSGAWPSGIGGGFSIYAQALVLDAGAPHGLAFTNAVVGTTPY